MRKCSSSGPLIYYSHASTETRSCIKCPRAMSHWTSSRELRTNAAEAHLAAGSATTRHVPSGLRRASSGMQTLQVLHERPTAAARVGASRWRRPWARKAARLLDSRRAAPAPTLTGNVVCTSATSRLAAALTSFRPFSFHFTSLTFHPVTVALEFRPPAPTPISQRLCDGLMRRRITS